MKKIGINFGDNDFYYTISTFLDLLGKGYEDEYRMKEYWPEGAGFNKKDIVALFNKGASVIYWLRQNGKTYNKFEWDQIPDMDYLTITEEQVFIDDEVDEYIKKCEGWSNGEFFALVLNDDKYDLECI